MKKLLILSALAIAFAFGQAKEPPKSGVLARETYINKESLEARLAQLQKQYEQTVVTAQILQGAIQDCQFWLARIQAEEKPAAKPPEKK